MPLLQGPDCNLWVEQIGEGDPVTMYSHGITSSIDELKPLAASTHGTRILFDLRGHGRSSVATHHDLAAIRRDLEFVADHFNATRAFGISVSAGALLNLLCDQPDRFERVALFLPASIDEPNEAAISSFPVFAEDLETLTLEKLANRDSLVDNDLHTKRPYWRALVKRRTMNMNGTGVPHALRAYASGPPPAPDVSLLEKVSVPVLVLSHEGDLIHEARQARRLARTFQNASLHIWPETLSMYDDLPAFSRLIADFFNS